ncbi:hypothetical protein RF11_04303 [Thelohanellus kitauei]|uniref:Uncharacterized protein n=1 Tax=Thelohanellus kitauei TaxID=669202 RepID=A0A0C2N6T4_THEKT|nr:hypothetical protein RF11_04303 [Thelohanellus kitauei]
MKENKRIANSQTWHRYKIENRGQHRNCGNNHRLKLFSKHKKIENDNSSIFCLSAHKIKCKHQWLKEFESEISLKDLNGIEIGHLPDLSSTNINIFNHISD